MTESVLIVDDRRDVLELNRILLESEGYATDGCSYVEATSERIKQTAPRVVLLDLVEGDEAPWTLLQRLRRDDVTSQIGVVVTSDTPPLVERALSDGQLGVTAGLVMPFDIDALYAAIGVAARDGRSVAPSVASVPLLQRGAAIIRQRHQRILIRWVQRLSALDVFRNNPELSLADLQGWGGDILDGVAEALSLQATTRAVPAAAAGVCISAAHKHANLRRAQGVRPADIAREMVALRRETWREIRGEIARDAPPLDDVFRLLSRLHLALDESLFAILAVYESDMAS